MRNKKIKYFLEAVRIAELIVPHAKDLSKIPEFPNQKHVYIDDGKFTGFVVSQVVLQAISDFWSVAAENLEKKSYQRIAEREAEWWLERRESIEGDGPDMQYMFGKRDLKTHGAWLDVMIAGQRNYLQYLLDEQKFYDDCYREAVRERQGVAV